MSFLRRRHDDVAEPVEEAPVVPMARGEVAERLQQASTQSGRQLADNLLPAVRFAIQKEPDGAVDIGRSKFGGAPDLPKGTFWPSWTPPGGEKRLLQFFAQVDLTETAHASAPAELGLPKDGMLSFFADFDPKEGSIPGPEAVEVFYSPGESQMHRCGLRMPPLPTAWLHPVGTWTWPDPADGDRAALKAVDEEREANLAARMPPHSHLTGRHQTAGHISGADGVVLLQFDSEPTLDIAWGPAGNSGRLLWTIPAADLASRNWPAARFSLL